MDKYNRAAKDISGMKDPLAQVFLGVGTSVAAVGDIEVMFDKLSRVAPNDIAPDVEAARDSMKKALDNLGNAASNPLAALANSFVIGFSSSGSWQRVSDWTVTHCGSA